MWQVFAPSSRVSNEHEWEVRDVENCLILWNCSISENQSLVVMRPWWNLWLIGAVVVSMCLHFVILEIEFLAVSLPLQLSSVNLDVQFLLCKRLGSRSFRDKLRVTFLSFFMLTAAPEALCFRLIGSVLKLGVCHRNMKHHSTALACHLLVYSCGKLAWEQRVFFYSN